MWFMFLDDDQWLWFNSGILCDYIVWLVRLNMIYVGIIGVVHFFSSLFNTSGGVGFSRKERVHWKIKSK